MLCNSCGSFTSFIACFLPHSIPQGQGEASSGPVHSLLLDQLSVGVHAELQEVLVCFHSRRHCKLGESVERRGGGGCNVVNLVHFNGVPTNPLGRR